MTIQIIYAEIVHNVLRKIPGHIVDGWLCDLKGSLVFKIQVMIVYRAEFHLQTLHLQRLELYSVFPWLFHPFWLLQKCCCLSKFQEESFRRDIPSVKGPVGQSSLVSEPFVHEVSWFYVGDTARPSSCHHGRSLQNARSWSWFWSWGSVLWEILDIKMTT